MKTDLWETIVAAIITLVVGLIGGAGFMESRYQKQAIAAGVARYTVNPATGETKFEYIKPTQAQ